MLLASAVVVWEWLNEHGRWRPYSPAVSHHIEAVARGGPRAGGSVVLGQADSRLAPYIIDLQSMHQFRQDTGTIRPVRRSYYDPSSAPGKGVVWEWENDSGSWTPYDMDVGITIQRAYEKQHPWVDLSAIGFCYVIDFATMGQINRQTQRKRRVRRRLDMVYPLVSGTLPKSQSWPASPGAAAAPLAPTCTCPQCLLVMSVKATVSATGPGAATLQPRKAPPAPPAALKAPAPAPGAKAPDSVAVARGSLKPPAAQGARRQAASALALGSAASPPGTGSSKAAHPGLGTLNRSHLQRLAIAQSRVLIASGVPTVPVKNLTGSSPVNPALAGITGILMSAAGLPVCLTRPPKLVLHPPPVSKSEIQSIPGISHTCRKTTKKQAKKGKSPEEVLKKYLQKVRHPPDEDCTICMERLSAPSGYKGPQPAVKPDLVGKLVKCGHIFHLHCLVAMYNNGNKDGSLQCPTCKTIYGVKTGTQPPGKMEYHLIPHALPGHSDCKTIRIIYNIPPGVQGPEHPNPGKSFTARGFPRHCYLPDSEKGRKVLKLLLVAWDRRLIFAIGTSSTTGPLRATCDAVLGATMALATVPEVLSPFTGTGCAHAPDLQHPQGWGAEWGQQPPLPRLSPALHRCCQGLGASQPVLLHSPPGFPAPPGTLVGRGARTHPAVRGSVVITVFPLRGRGVCHPQLRTPWSRWRGSIKRMARDARCPCTAWPLCCLLSVVCVAR